MTGDRLLDVLEAGQMQDAKIRNQVVLLSDSFAQIAAVWMEKYREWANEEAESEGGME